MKRRKSFKKQKSSVDKKLFGLTVFLTFIGVVAVADASAPQALNFFSDEFYFAKQQVLYAIAGLLLMIVVSNIKYTFWSKVAKPLFFFSVFLLLLVFVPGLGTSALGAKRWLSFGPVNLQPSEIVKFSMAIYLAKVAESKKETLSYFLPLGLVAFLIMLQPDLGTTLVIVSIGMAQIFLSGINIIHFLSAGVSAGILTFILIMTSNYRRQRFLTFLKNTTDPLGEGYHIRQILLALGSGGIFGVGLGQSRQKYLFLPEAATDSIFAVIAEEIGFVGAGVLIVLFVWLIIRALKIVKGAPDTFSSVLAVGLTLWIASQTFLNIGSMISLVPLTGLPLPLISYGGTSLVTVLAAIGILLNISRYGKAR